MDESFKSLTSNLRSVLILLPRDPYFDQVAAGLSLYLSFRESKDVSISCPSPMLVEFNRLVGVDKVTSELGNKNLVLKLTDFDPQRMIEKVTYDIIDNEMNIIVIPKPSVVPPKKEQVDISYSGIAAGLVILIGGLHERHFPALSSKDLLETRVAHIGISEVNLPPGKQVISFARPASSVSEVTAELIKSVSESLTSDVATNLLMGIYDGSKNFSSSGVSPETFKLAAELMVAGGRYTPKEKVEKKNFPPGAIPVGVPPLEKPEVESTTPPKSWLEPKIFKGTSVS